MSAPDRQSLRAFARAVEDLTRSFHEFGEIMARTTEAIRDLGRVLDYGLMPERRLERLVAAYRYGARNRGRWLSLREQLSFEWWLLTLGRGDGVRRITHRHEGLVLRVNNGRSVDVVWTTDESFRRHPEITVDALLRARAMGLTRAVEHFGEAPLYVRHASLSTLISTVWVERNVDPLRLWPGAPLEGYVA